jgi:glutamate N-acetyltransferase/amino-acid N-acetyltransferase
VVVATNKAAHAPITSLDSAEGQALKAAMLDVAQKLAQAIVRDGEGRHQVHHGAGGRRQDW